MMMARLRGRRVIEKKRFNMLQVKHSTCTRINQYMTCFAWCFFNFISVCCGGRRRCRCRCFSLSSCDMFRVRVCIDLLSCRCPLLFLSFFFFHIFIFILLVIFPQPLYPKLKYFSVLLFIITMIIIVLCFAPFKQSVRKYIEHKYFALSLSISFCYRCSLTTKRRETKTIAHGYCS